MTSQKTLLAGGLVLTMDPAAGDLPDHDVLIEDGKIVAIGRNLSADAERIDVTGKIVLPGFVDSHRHTWQTQLRFVGADWLFMDYLAQLRGVLGPLYRPEDMYIANLLGSVESMYSGITTLLDWNHLINTPEHADASIEGLRDAGIRGVFCYSTGNDGFVPTPSGVTVDVHDAERVRDAYFSGQNGLLTMAYGPLGTELGGESTVAPDFAAARRLGLPISVHVGFFGQWLHQVDYLHDHDLLGPDVTLLHCNATTDDEWSYIADSGATLSISPESEMHLGCGLPPIAQALHHGVKPSISSDVPSVMGTDMFGQMRTLLGVMRGMSSQAYLGENGVAGAPKEFQNLRIGSHDILEYATVEGARTVGLGDRTGTIAVGKQADIVVVSTEAPTLQPLVNPSATVVLGASAADVECVLVAGRIVKRDGRMVGFDLDDIRRRAEASRDYLLEAAGLDLDQFLTQPVRA